MYLHLSQTNAAGALSPRPTHTVWNHTRHSSHSIHVINRRRLDSRTPLTWQG